MQTTVLLATSQQLHHGTALQLHIGERFKNTSSFDRVKEKDLQVRAVTGLAILSDVTVSQRWCLRRIIFRTVRILPMNAHDEMY